MPNDALRPPRIIPDDVLESLGTGLFLWDHETDSVTLDSRGARLCGLPAHLQTTTLATARACVAVEDFVGLRAVLALAVTEQTYAEFPVRVINGGTVLWTVRIRARATDLLPGGRAARISGTLCEVPAESGLLPSGGPAPARRHRAREAFLLDAGRALAEADSTAEVLRVAAGLSMPGFSPDGLAVFGLRGDRLSILGQQGHRDNDTRPFEGMPLATDYPAALVVRTGRAVYLPTQESYKEKFPSTWPLAEGFGRNSWAFLPLVFAGRTMGAWMAAFRDPVAFTPDERSVLTTVARLMGQALSRASVQESQRELSDGLQRSMLPAGRPAVPGMHVAARYVPTGGGLQVGGDWYDVIDLPSGRTALVIGDVQGHDVLAAGLMGRLRIAVRAYAAEGHGPGAVLSRSSRFLAGLGGEGDDRFATCLYLEIDPDTGTLDVVRAGHPEPAIRLEDGTTLLRRTTGGLPLGVAADSDYPTTRLVLEPGETLLLCTDGLIETGGHDLETGWRRLLSALGSGPDDDLEVLADSLIRAVHGPASHHMTGPLTDRREDDVALILLRREAAGRADGAPVRRTTLTVSQTEPQQIREARDEVRALLHDWTMPDQVDSAVLLTSEVITNVLTHTDGDAALTAALSGALGGRRLRITVSDRSDEMPHVRTRGELTASGRGVFLIEELATRWGADPRGDGKCVWFELDEAPAS